MHLSITSFQKNKNHKGKRKQQHTALPGYSYQQEKWQQIRSAGLSKSTNQVFHYQSNKPTTNKRSRVGTLFKQKMHCSNPKKKPNPPEKGNRLPIQYLSIKWNSPKAKTRVRILIK